MIRWRYITGALVLTLSFIASCLSPMVANAASDYDGVITTADELRLEQNSSHGSAKRTVSTTWYSIFSDCDNWTSPSGSYGVSCASANTALSAAFENGTGWAVAQRTMKGEGTIGGVAIYPGDKFVTVLFNPGSDVHGEFRADDGTKKLVMTGSDYTYAFNIALNNDPDEAKPVVSNGNSTKNMTSEYPIVDSDDTYPLWDSSIFFANIPITYPSGYAGTDAPDSEPSSKTTVKPDYTYSINVKDVTAKDYGQSLPEVTPDEGYTINGYSVEWTLYKCGSWTEVGHLCNSPTVTNHTIQPQDQQYQYSVDTFGDYQLSAQYLVQECYRYPSYPATPDNCFYVDLGTELPAYNFLTTTIHLPINGSSTSGDTKEGECDASGFCTPPSPYEDCTTYGLDLGGYIGCLIRNFQVWFIATLKALFVPSAAFMQNYFNDFKDFITHKFGFLVWPLTFAYNFINAFFDGLSGTNNICNWSFGNFFSGNFTLNFCSLEQNFPSTFNTARYMIQAFTVFVLISGLYTHYRRTIRT